MTSPKETSWTIIQNAGAGEESARAEFVLRYTDFIRAYLGRRWRRGPLLQYLDDTVQDVFVECLKEGGVLENANPDHPSGFRAFLCGVNLRVAWRAEDRWKRNREEAAATAIRDLELDDATQSQVFDQEWAKMIMREAGAHQKAEAAAAGPEALRRVELLQVRVDDEVRIGLIAEQWGVEAEWLHRQYRVARKEFKESLRVVLAHHHGGSVDNIDAEAKRLLSLLG